MSTRPILNSERPTVNRSFLTEEQARRRDAEIAGHSLKSAGEGAIISAGVSAASDAIHSKKIKPDETAMHAALHGGLAGGFRALYEFGVDTFDYVTGRVAGNVGEYAPDLNNPQVVKALLEVAQQEFDNGNYTRLPDGKITTPTLSQLGLSCSE